MGPIIWYQILIVMTHMIAMGALNCADMGPSVQGHASMCSAYICSGVKFWKNT